MYWVVNGKNTADFYSEYSVTFTGVRCKANCFEVVIKPVDENKTIETTDRLWSNPNSWPPENKVPVAGDKVEIKPGWNMIMDLNVTPIFNYTEINGLLTFKPNMSHHFRTKVLMVRAGELHIGNATHPHLNETKITLHGRKEDPAYAFDNSIAAVNKFFANINKVRIFGGARKKTLSRLHKPATKGSKEIYVEPSLDFVKGDQLTLAPTTYEFHAVD